MLQINDYYWVRAAFDAVEPPGTIFRTQRIEDFGAASSFEAALILFMIGAADILDDSGRVIAKRRVNLGVSGAPKVGPSKKTFFASASHIGLDIPLVDRYLQRSRAQQNYYRELTLEVLHYAHRSKRGQHTVAFLHLYRFLERVSYVFPITYALKSEDFKGTYDSFRAYIAGEKSGELKFFQKFQTVAIEKDVREASMRFDFQSLPFDGEKSGYALVKKFSSDICFMSENINRDITIQSQGVVELAINLRNRFFHASSGHTENVSLVELADPDGFFARINENFLNWLAIVYFQTLIAKSERYSL